MMSVVMIINSYCYSCLIVAAANAGLANGPFMSPATTDQNNIDMMKENRSQAFCRKKTISSKE